MLETIFFIIVIISFNFVVVPFLLVFGGGGIIVTLVFLLIGSLDQFMKGVNVLVNYKINDELLIPIIGAIVTFLIVYTIYIVIMYIIHIFKKDVENYGIHVYRQRSCWYMCILILISYFYYNIYLSLKDDYIYH